MKTEKRKQLSREEFAVLLSNFAKRIAEDKRIVFEDMDVSVPDSFEVELEYKEKHGHAKFEIELCWNTGTTGGNHWGFISALKNSVTKSTKSEHPIPDNFKEIKKGIERTIGEIANTVNKGARPSEGEIDYFRDLIKAFRQQSEPEWEDGMYRLQTAVDAMCEAIENVNFPLALDRIREINNIKNECHRVFK